MPCKGSMISFTFASRSFEFGKLVHMRQFLKSYRLWNTRPLLTFMVQSLFFLQFVNVCYGQNSESIDFQSGEKVSAENRAKAKKLVELVKKARQENQLGLYFPNATSIKSIPQIQSNKIRWPWLYSNKRSKKTPMFAANYKYQNTGFRYWLHQRRSSDRSVLGQPMEL